MQHERLHALADAVRRVALLALRRALQRMTACLCPSCTDRPAPSYTEAFRHQCEVAYVIGLPGRAERVGYFALVRQRRGAAAARRLRDEAIAAWKAGRDSMSSGGVWSTAGDFTNALNRSADDDK